MQTPKQNDVNPILATVGLRILIPPSWVSVNDTGYDVRRVFPAVANAELRHADLIIMASQRDDDAMPPVVQDVMLNESGVYLGDVVAIRLDSTNCFLFRLSLNRNARLRKRGHMTALFESAIEYEDMFGPPIERKSVSEFLAMSLANLRNRIQPVTAGVQVFGGSLDEVSLEDFEMTPEGIHGLIHFIENNDLAEDPYWRIPYILHRALMQQMEKQDG